MIFFTYVRPLRNMPRLEKALLKEINLKSPVQACDYISENLDLDLRISNPMNLFSKRFRYIKNPDLDLLKGMQNIF